jgi:hypothetical protein
MKKTHRNSYLLMFRTVGKKSRKEVGDLSLFAKRSRRLSPHFAVVNLIPCRLPPTQPFSERLPTYA